MTLEIIDLNPTNYCLSGVTLNTVNLKFINFCLSSMTLEIIDIKSTNYWLSRKTLKNINLKPMNYCLYWMVSDYNSNNPNYRLPRYYRPKKSPTNSWLWNDSLLPSRMNITNVYDRTNFVIESMRQWPKVYQFNLAGSKFFKSRVRFQIRLQDFRWATQDRLDEMRWDCS